MKVGALSAEEARSNVHHRLRIAGSQLNLFTTAAIRLAYGYSGAIPRLINLYCHRALVHGYGGCRPRINDELTSEAIEDRRTSGIAR